MPAFTDQGDKSTPAGLRRAIWDLIERYVADVGLVEAGWRPTEQGLAAWSYDPVFVSTQTVAVAGTLYAQRVKLRTDATITNVILNIGTAGSGLTAGQCFAGLYRAGGALVAATADQSGSWNSTGNKTMALVGGPYALPAFDYYVVYFANGTTPPAFGRSSTTGGAGGANTGLSAPNLRSASADTGLTTTFPPAMGAQSTSAIVGWVALS